MENILRSLAETLSHAGLTPGRVLIFMSVATITILVAGLLQARSDIRRRTSSSVTSHESGTPASARHRLLEYVDRHFRQEDSDNLRLLRQKLIQAGFLDPRAVGGYFAIRVLALILAAILGSFLVPWFRPQIDVSGFWMGVGFSAVLGYFLPGILLNKRIKSRQDEHRYGFPDFMDLMVVCADAGLSIESAIDRVGRELTLSYPSLAGNLYMAVLEMRAGRTLSEALNHLSDRLGIEEARSFATLLQQSEELGASITEALRVYSDEMRNKRLMSAEEKAYALPAKMVIPMGLCIFPIVLIVTMLPAAIKMMDRF